MRLLPRHRHGGLAFAALLLAACADPPESFLPTGQRVTPLAAAGAVAAALDPGLPGLPDYRAGQAVALAPSPDGKLLLVLTSGFNRVYDAAGRRVPAASMEYVFVFDISGGAPRQRQAIAIPNTFLGIAWSPDGTAFHVSGGADDSVRSFRRDGADFVADGAPIALGHAEGLGLGTRPAAAGLAVDPTGTRLIVANYENDSVSLVDLASRRVVAELDLRPGKGDPAQRGTPGGEYPLAIAWQAPGKAYAASERDREIVVLGIAGDNLAVTGRIKIEGQPNALLLDGAHQRLYAGADNSDRVVVVDTARDAVIGEIPVAGPPSVLPNPRSLRGANPNGLAIAPDGRSLLVSLGGLNAVAAIALAPVQGAAAKDRDGDGDEDAAASPIGRVVGLVPTGWYPNAVALGPGGAWLYVANGKSPPGANPGACRDNLVPGRDALARCLSRNQYVWQLEKGGLLALPMPDGRELARLTLQVARNDNFAAAAAGAPADARMAFLRSHIRHIVYVVKENRSYDQILGDLEIGDGDPALALLPERLTPNHHALARGFVTLDAFFASGESSNTGWSWSTAARSTDFTEKEAPVNYGNRGLQYDAEGLNRLINVGIADPAERRRLNPAIRDDPDLLPGTADVAAPDSGSRGAGAGYLWDAALAAGRSLRNFGFFGDFTLEAPLLRDPAGAGTAIFHATKPALAPLSDPYYRGFDMRLPDFWRVREWEREFDAMLAADAVPDLMLVRLPNDHFGSFANALDGVDTVETQMADNDYALGRLVERIAASPIRDDTLIFVIEDDAQGGADHVDAHRSLAFVAGPYVKQRALVSTRYTTVSVLRTIEEILGLAPLGLNDGLAAPMDDIFDPALAQWRYRAVVPEALRATRLPLPAATAARAAPCAAALHGAAYWEARMAGQDFSQEDRLDEPRFNAALWHGLKGDAAPPPGRSGRDLRADRAALLVRAAACPPVPEGRNP